jgi:hypothetical protein
LTASAQACKSFRYHYTFYKLFHRWLRAVFLAALQPERIQNTEYNFIQHYLTGASMAAPDPANSSKK